MSHTLPRSTIEEIKIKYKREPTLAKTIFIEGSTDKALIKWFLKQAKYTNLSILSIDAVEVPKSEVLALGLEDNNRNRIITITTLIDDNIIGIIDSDFDFIQEIKYPQSDNLCQTDYANMEMYLYNEETLEKIFLVYHDSKNAEEFFKLSYILIELFLITYAKKNIKNELPSIDFVKELTLKVKTISFDLDKYLDKYLKHNKGLIAEFKSFIDDIKTRLPKEEREIMDGHDFVALLQFYLEVKHPKEKEVFSKSLYSSLEYNTLKDIDMFKKLLSLI